MTRISKQSVLAGICLALLLAFSLVTGCTSSQEAAAPATAELSDDTVRSDAALWNADELDWADMSKAEQELWGALGWNEKKWSGDSKAPASEDKYWKQLSDEERAACEKLGYSKRLWDGS